QDDNVSIEREAIGNQTNGDFYKQNKYYFSVDNTLDSTVYQLYQNKLGLKGRKGKLYYEGFYKHRMYKFRHYFESDEQEYETETFVGGRLQFQKRGLYLGRASFEVSPIGEYLAKAKIGYKNFQVNYLNSQQVSSIFQDAYYSNHIQWRNDNYEFISNSSINASAQFKIAKNWKISPMAEYTTVGNAIYFGVDSLPQQNNETVSLLVGGLYIKGNWKQIHFRELIKYAQSNSDIYKVPTINSFTQLYWQKSISLLSKEERARRKDSKLLFVQIGTDLYYQSAYTAHAYSPISQQFYVQNEIDVQGYLVADVFLNVQLNKIRAFFKYTHVNQGLWGGGYQVTPYFAGKRRVFEFGLGWMFFD
ncbi:MAG: putative porin, partial [Cytophagales bacterium]|nr:putative porin [Cytophagales bacterium]